MEVIIIIEKQILYIKREPAKLFDYPILKIENSKSDYTVFFRT